jgi:hypothetical protein
LSKNLIGFAAKAAPLAGPKRGREVLDTESLSCSSAIYLTNLLLFYMLSVQDSEDTGDRPAIRDSRMATSNAMGNVGVVVEVP